METGVTKKIEDVVNTVSGNLSYREPVKLSENAVAYVRLVIEMPFAWEYHSPTDTDAVRAAWLFVAACSVRGEIHVRSKPEGTLVAKHQADLQHTYGLALVDNAVCLFDGNDLHVFPVRDGAEPRVHGAQLDRVVELELGDVDQREVPNRAVRAVEQEQVRELRDRDGQVGRRAVGPDLGRGAVLGARGRRRPRSRPPVPGW